MDDLGEVLAELAAVAGDLRRAGRMVNDASNHNAQAVGQFESTAGNSHRRAVRDVLAAWRLAAGQMEESRTRIAAGYAAIHEYLVSIGTGDGVSPVGVHAPTPTGDLLIAAGQEAAAGWRRARETAERNMGGIGDQVRKSVDLHRWLLHPKSPPSTSTVAANPRLAKAESPFPVDNALIGVVAVAVVGVKSVQLIIPKVIRSIRAWKVRRSG